MWLFILKLMLNFVLNIILNAPSWKDLCFYNNQLMKCFNTSHIITSNILKHKIIKSFEIWLNMYYHDTVQ